MALRVKPKVGDIFQVPLDTVRFGYGQVVALPEKNVLFICLFAATTERSVQPDLQAIVRSAILLAGNTFDAKLWHGHWPVVGNMTPDLAAIVLPNYKEGPPGQAFVENLDLTRRRRATPQEEAILPFRSYVAPVRYEKALQALAGIGEWRPEYEDLRYEHVLG
jgi:hypothetical protein